MLGNIAWACHRARRHAGVTVLAIAHHGRIDQSTLYRFERATSYPKRLDHVISTYAACCDLHPLELWEAAINRWHLLNGA